jgi:hypothetical protein
MMYCTIGSMIPSICPSIQSYHLVWSFIPRINFCPVKAFHSYAFHCPCSHTPVHLKPKRASNSGIIHPSPILVDHNLITYPSLQHTHFSAIVALACAITPVAFATSSGLALSCPASNWSSSFCRASLMRWRRGGKTALVSAIAVRCCRGES